MNIHQTFFRRTAFALLSASWVFIALAADNDKPTNPFDYNFCGGERVYPIIGVNFSTHSLQMNLLSPLALPSTRALTSSFVLEQNEHFGSVSIISPPVV